jgi:hypothetical protein
MDQEYNEIYMRLLEIMTGTLKLQLWDEDSPFENDFGNLTSRRLELRIGEEEDEDDVFADIEWTFDFDFYTNNIYCHSDVYEIFKNEFQLDKETLNGYMLEFLNKLFNTSFDDIGEFYEFNT